MGFARAQPILRVRDVVSLGLNFELVLLNFVALGIFGVVRAGGGRGMVIAALRNREMLREGVT
jgi:hypothetical protein